MGVARESLMMVIAAFRKSNCVALCDGASYITFSYLTSLPFMVLQEYFRAFFIGERVQIEHIRA